MKFYEPLTTKLPTIGLVVTIALSITFRLDAADPVASQARDIGSRRELFVDTFLIDRLVRDSIPLTPPENFQYDGSTMPQTLGPGFGHIL